MPKDLMVVDRELLSQWHFTHRLDPAGTGLYRIALERCGPSFHLKRHSPRNFVIFYVLTGEGVFRTQGHEYRLTGDSVFMFGPGIPHEIRADTRTPMRYVVVATNGRGFVPFVSSHLGETNRVFTMRNTLEMRGLFETMLREAEQRNRFAHDICVNYLNTIILKLAAYRLQKAAHASPAMQTYIRCRAHIDEHFRSLRSAGEAAQACHIDVAYLCRLFRRFEKMSPYEYLLRTKMNEACHLLDTTPLSVKEIAYRLSFGDPCGFSRAFKRVLGMAPRDFRGT